MKAGRFPAIAIALLDNKLKSADVAARRLVSALGGPSHSHERGNRNRGIEHRQIAAQESVRLKCALAEDANAAVAEIVNAAIKFLWRGARRLTR